MKQMHSMVMATLIAVAIITLTTDHISADQFVRNKRGLSDFFKRFWNIRKKVNYMPYQQQSSIYPNSMNQDYVLPQASNYYPIYQLSQSGNQYGQYEPQMYGESSSVNNANQIDYQEYPLRQPTNNYYPSSSNQYQHQHQPDYQRGNPNNNGYQNSQAIQPDESVQKASYYYPNQGGQIGTSPYTFHANPSQANTFNSKPYGNQPGTLDVHQVLDQFIRSAGLSPHGDHENANKDRAYNDDQALSVKKLYSYPFYFSSSGDRPYTIRRQSMDEDEQPMDTVQRVVSKPAVKMEPVSSKKNQAVQTLTVNDVMADIVLDDERSFIAKNAAALQDFLANKRTPQNTSTSTSDAKADN
ncbi:uncharacterized protein LOC124492727 [Dermatophagoides farinae]|uniref:Uncharacterized protein n=1 Tax=Dermatophagoides farinae TaxID=6954 RepID=A0A9D4P7F2_DERFA|nr:uncharacterized protein LOC124492727 isoform X1 [Dermatophagoides farinae]KAH7645094.1 hypothetical protein HUG17_0632 [Dermatophagoides farinae]